MKSIIDFVKSLFVPDPGKKLRKVLDRKYKQAVEFQRNGKLREYAALMKEIEILEDEYIRVLDEER